MKHLVPVFSRALFSIKQDLKPLLTKPLKACKKSHVHLVIHAAPLLPEVHPKPIPGSLYAPPDIMNTLFFRSESPKHLKNQDDSKRGGSATAEAPLNLRRSQSVDVPLPYNICRMFRELYFLGNNCIIPYILHSGYSLHVDHSPQNDYSLFSDYTLCSMYAHHEAFSYYICRESSLSDIYKIFSDSWIF